MATEESKDWYRFTGMKDDWDETSRLILEGSSTNPKVQLVKGEEVELTDAQVETAKAAGARVSKVSDEKVAKLEEERRATQEAAPPKGSTQQAAGDTSPAGHASGTTKPKS